MTDAIWATLAAIDPDEPRDFILRFFNISSYVMLPWVLLGIIGQAMFFLRLSIQWIASERKKASVVPTIYWWFSLAGGAMLLTYFIWRQDAVGVLGQSTGSIVYARNLRLIYQNKKTEAVKPANDNSSPS